MHGRQQLFASGSPPLARTLPQHDSLDGPLASLHSHPGTCAQLFIFILCQSSLRLVIQKVLNLGMGREFQVRALRVSICRRALRGGFERAGCGRRARRARASAAAVCPALLLWQVSARPPPPAALGQDIMPAVPKGAPFAGMFGGEEPKKKK